MTGGPQRVSLNKASPVMNFDSNSYTGISSSSSTNISQDNSLNSASEKSDQIREINKQEISNDKSFSTFPKRNTINVDN